MCLVPALTSLQRLVTVQAAIRTVPVRLYRNWGESMQARAAVAWQAGKPLSLETVELEGPKAGEVMVEIKATGICHTDEYTLSGADPEGLFPTILGHEGAGVVVDVGPSVKSLKKGDHVIPLYVPECRECVRRRARPHGRAAHRRLVHGPQDQHR